MFVACFLGHLSNAPKFSQRVSSSSMALSHSFSQVSEALSMLKKFQAILQRDSLKEGLDSKFMVIFHDYGLDLDSYELHHHTFHLL